MSHPVIDAFGDWVFECRSESDSDVLADRDFESARDRLHKNGWQIKSEERHVCTEENKRKRLVKMMFFCSKPEPMKKPIDNIQNDTKKLSANDWDPYENE